MISKSLFRLFPTVSCAIALLAGAILHEVRGDSITIIYSGNLDGELEPCGCTPEGNMGGIKRQVSIIDELKKTTKNIVVLSSGGLISAYAANEQLVAEYIFKGFQRLEYDAIGIQKGDLAYGREFLARVALPWVSANWTSVVSTPSRVIERRGHKLFVTSWLEGDSTLAAMASDTPPRESTQEIAKLLAQAKSAAMTTVLMSPFSESDSKTKFDLSTVDILIIKSAYEDFGNPRRTEGGTLVLEPGSRGMRLGKVDVSINLQGRVESYQNTVIPMPTSVPDAPRMADWYEEYNARVKENYLRSVELRKSQREGLLQYAGEAACKSCHVAQHEIWTRSRHASAFDALHNVNKAFDPACIVCHTVGFNKEGGYIDDLVTDYLRNVQCESCHGAGRAHVAADGKAPLGHAGWDRERICGQCHVPKHSPKFKVSEYWPKIQH